jgi:hypothetical protein
MAKAGVVVAEAIVYIKEVFGWWWMERHRYIL